MADTTITRARLDRIATTARRLFDELDDVLDRPTPYTELYLLHDTLLGANLLLTNLSDTAHFWQQLPVKSTTHLCPLCGALRIIEDNTTTWISREPGATHFHDSEPPCTNKET